MVKKRFTGGLNETGHRVGEWHPKSKLTDREVEEIRDLHESGRMGYDLLAKAYGVTKWAIRDIVKYRTRCTTPSRYKDYFKDSPD